MGTDKRGRSALILSRKLDIGIKCAWAMPHEIRKDMGAMERGRPTRASLTP
jgi:hypothetical protein